MAQLQTLSKNFPELPSKREIPEFIHGGRIEKKAKKLKFKLQRLGKVKKGEFVRREDGQKKFKSIKLKGTQKAGTSFLQKKGADVKRPKFENFPRI